MTRNSTTADPTEAERGPLSLASLLAGRRLVVVGGTGFLGKVWWAYLLFHFPSVERIYLVVRQRGTQSAEQRFWKEIAESECLRPFRERYGSDFGSFLREKVVPVAGDVVQPFCGLEPGLRNDLRGNIDALVNASGVVDFDPPLDEALEVNAFGVQNLIALARDLGNVPFLHTSTAFVAGSRTGFIEETDPAEHPFPRAGELERAHWDPDREIAECMDVIEQARHRSTDAFRQSRFLDEAKRNLTERGEPARGAPLDAEVDRVKRKFVEARLSEMGMERANFWGFPNTYTYTKAIGEQIVAVSDVPHAITRPAIVESTVRFPFPSWNEGINTSAPLIYALREGQTQIPGADHYLDVIPCDMVAGGMTLALAELLDGSHRPVYQLGSSDTNPCTMRRFFELSGLYKRQYYQRTGRGGPVLSALQSHFEGALLDDKQFFRFGPGKVAQGASLAARWIKKGAVGPAAPLLGPTSELLSGFASQQQKVHDVLAAFVPFTARYQYVFRCGNARDALERLSDAERETIFWQPESIDWRRWFLDVHIPGLEKWVFPQIDERIRRPRRAPERHATLTALLDEMADRFDLAVALQRTEAEGLSRITFAEWRARSLAFAARLEALGVESGDRVLLAGANHPAWPIAFFGILHAGATVVPLDEKVEPAVVENLARASGAKVFVADEGVMSRVRRSVDTGTTRLSWLELRRGAERGAPRASGREPLPDEVAALIFTSGTTGTPKGVMLSHANLTALVASLAPLFPLEKGDRVLSVLPLHHTFELTCGMLLPLSRGARIVYLDELTAERLELGLKSGRITAMIGVPALWEMLERRIASRVAERGRFASRVFDIAVELNRSLGKTLGVDAGKLLFGPVHEGLGGHLRYLVSGGAALPERTHHLFAGLGLHLAEGYGLTEAAPVLTVASAGPRSKSGHVGKPVPGVEVKIHEPNGEGVGEVLACGPNVMLGYSDDDEGTRRTIDADGWLHTGDLGKIDRKGQLVIVGRAKDVIVSANGENVYPDDVEARLGEVDGVAELAIVGIVDPRGGERVACVAVPADDNSQIRSERHARAKTALARALAKLPPGMRPAVVTLVDGKLPRTATRKVKRTEVRRLAERMAPLSERPPKMTGESDLDTAARSVRAAVGVIAKRNPHELVPEQSLRGDLGFDSLMLLELLVALESQLGGSVDAERLNACETVGDAEALIRERRGTRRGSDTASIEQEAETPLDLPPPLREAAMHWLGRAQMGFYDRVLETKVTGRAFIPHNRNVLVAANHASHLDMGLVKYALGSYGQGLVSLAAQDYFFEGNRWRKAYFENLTNLVPMSRSGSLRQSLRQAGELISEGNTLLIFPEGTRSSDGEVREFKPAVGYLALQHGIDVLPVYLGGTFAAMPKGASLLRRRDVCARIGPPLLASDLRRLIAGLSSSDASRAVAELARRAVLALSRGEVFELSALESLDAVGADSGETSLATVFEEIEARFVPGAVEEPVTFYFSLGEGERWTLEVEPDACRVTPGKAVASADCVLKTTPGMFRRIVCEAYTPSPAEFMSGAVKSNNIELLIVFQRAFRLEVTSRDRTRRSGRVVDAPGDVE
jgi:long-chain acyl-CoA synthetase